MLKTLFLFSIIICQSVQKNNSVLYNYAFQLKSCFNSAEFFNCMTNKTNNILDSAMADSSEWKVNDMITIKPNGDSFSKNNQTNMLKKTISEKIRNIVQSRHLEIKLNNNDVQARKKKNGKHSNGMMMLGGFAMVGMLAQLILGKITALAAAALILAKIALVFSTLNGLKKSSNSQGEVYVDPHGGYGNGAWQ